MMNDAMFVVRTWKKKSARERMCVISLIRNPPALQRTNQTGEGKECLISLSLTPGLQNRRGLLPPGPLGLEPALRAQEWIARSRWTGSQDPCRLWPLYGCDSQILEKPYELLLQYAKKKPDWGVYNPSGLKNWGSYGLAVSVANQRF